MSNACGPGGGWLAGMVCNSSWDLLQGVGVAAAGESGRLRMRKPTCMIHNWGVIEGEKTKLLKTACAGRGGCWLSFKGGGIYLENTRQSILSHVVLRARDIPPTHVDCGLRRTSLRACRPTRTSVAGTGLARMYSQEWKVPRGHSCRCLLPRKEKLRGGDRRMQSHKSIGVS